MRDIDGDRQGYCASRSAIAAAVDSKGPAGAVPASGSDTFAGVRSRRSRRFRTVALPPRAPDRDLRPTVKPRIRSEKRTFGRGAHD